MCNAPRVIFSIVGEEAALKEVKLTKCSQVVSILMAVLIRNALGANIRKYFRQIEFPLKNKAHCTDSV